ncbi:hypothetical protein E3N88_45414 [Mikania micrantha]|uniref:HAT C-terminal dimerisation domain-containing protein n=1 Tax=Mikania micrantha TaxID=192012 RepID=A0A5N6L981_9ASTR|nr:hypothetical protein E3N88_45414 [Mikania micrantha]
MVREMMGNLVIQESLPLNHFENPRLTKMIQKALQPRYHQVRLGTYQQDGIRLGVCLTAPYDMVREMMGNLVIQESLPLNHFENPRLTKMIQKALQPRYHQVRLGTYQQDGIRLGVCLTAPYDKGKPWKQNVTKRARGTSASSELGRYLATDWISSLTPEEFENFDILARWKQKEPDFPILSAMARDLLSVQASTVASESVFSLNGRVLSIRRTRLTPASLEMCICLKDHLDAMERVQDHTQLEGELEIEVTIHDVEVEEGMTFPLSDEEQAMDEWMLNNSPELQSEAPSED